MRRRYRLSKIGKEKRKSGLFRFCGPRRQKAGNAIAGAIRSGSVAAAGGLPKEARQRAELGPGPARANLAISSQARLTNRAIKKLPQAGQEPVEAVESGHSNPDGPYANP